MISSQLDPALVGHKIPLASSVPILSAMSSGGFNAELTLGPSLVGTIVASALFGCAAIQTQAYYRRFSSDPLLLKALVAALMLLTLAHILCIVHWTWTITVTHFGEPAAVAIFIPSRGANLVISAFIFSLVQLFFVYRLFSLSRHWLLAIICCILSGVSLVGMVIDAAIILHGGNYNAESWLAVPSLACAASCDLVVTGSLVFYLRKKRGRRLPRTTVQLLDKLTRCSIGTGLVTSIIAVLVIVLFSLQRTTFVWVALYNVLSDVYTNTLLTSLNGRNLPGQDLVPTTLVFQTVLCDVDLSCPSSSVRETTQELASNPGKSQGETPNIANDGDWAERQDQPGVDGDEVEGRKDAGGL